MANLSSSRVRVVLRVRPFLTSEIDSEETKQIPCITVLDPQSSGEVTVHLKDQWTSRNECYKLDSFFGQEDRVAQIFDKEASAVIPGIFQGLNATVFAYGATGSGKTYTMQGTENEPGLIPLTMSTIFNLRETTQYSVDIAYYEVYMDRCYDLLEPKAKEVIAMDDKEGRVQLKGLSWASVNSMDEFTEVYSAGVQRRKVAHTGLNDVSSRSHAVLSVAVTSGNVKGKLNLIDLAGNEDNRKTGNDGIRLQESAKINQSLFALSNVIYALNNNELRIPYRESKLTRILQDSLGGTSQALMIACLNPVSYQEAVHTVSLAARSRHIVNYVGSARKPETPKLKVDMEAKLRAWLESKGKTKSIQRMNGLFSPSQGKTPKSINYPKQHCSVRSSSKATANDQEVSRTKKKILFDTGISSATTGVSHMHQENTNPSELPAENIHMSGKKETTLCKEDTINEQHDIEHENSLLSFSHSSEVEMRETNAYTTSFGTPCNKENLKFPSSDSVGSMGAQIRGLQNSDRKVLFPISTEADNGSSLICLEPKTPRATCGVDEIQIGATPLDKFNAQSSHLKESLVQEYLAFLNVASR
ncbi:kinesin-like protein KIN-10C [Ananas comosus]|uniref:Kinesin-like protein n=1 Tax=Ananas comosus TaxID=4615 RepID=A0A6P5HBP8_ANACO|nr:kinesin-like protein KIN-10C [Ananas comosus]